MGKLENVRNTDDMTISSVDVSHLIGLLLKCDNAAWSKDLCAEYYKFTHLELNVLLSLCFKLFLHILICIHHSLKEL